MKVFKKGEYLVREGEKTETIFILVSGRIGVYKGSLKVTEFREKGVIVGEMSAILGEPRTASLRAIEQTLVINIDCGIDKLVEDYPEIAHKIMVNLAQRLKRTTDEYFTLATEITEKHLLDITESFKKQSS